MVLSFFLSVMDLVETRRADCAGVASGRSTTIVADTEPLPRRHLPTSRGGFVRIR